MKKQTKWVIGGVVVVLVAVSAILFSNTGLMKGSMQGLKLKSSAPAINKTVLNKAEAVLFKKLCDDNGGTWNGISLACIFKGVKYASRGAMQVAIGGGSSAPAANNSDPMYVNANWKCHGDAVESLQGGGSSCKPRSLWLSYATKACTGKSDPVTGKTGISTFGVSNPCSQQQAAPAEQAGAPVSAAPAQNNNAANDAQAKAKAEATAKAAAEAAAAGQAGAPVQNNDAANDAAAAPASSGLSSNGNVVDAPPASSSADQPPNGGAASPDAAAPLQADVSAQNQRPDLYVAVNGFSVENGRGTMTYTIRNIGTAPVNPHFSCSFYATPSPRTTREGDVSRIAWLGSTDVVGPIPAGGSLDRRTHIFNADPVNPWDPGIFQVGIKVDIGNTVTESNEDNNTSTLFWFEVE